MISHRSIRRAVENWDPIRAFIAGCGLEVPLLLTGEIDNFLQLLFLPVSLVLNSGLALLLVFLTGRLLKIRAIGSLWYGRPYIARGVAFLCVVIVPALYVLRYEYNNPVAREISPESTRFSTAELAVDLTALFATSFLMFYAGYSPYTTRRRRGRRFSLQGSWEENANSRSPRTD